ncbi:MAG: PqqD family protein [Eubacterium sp.]|nr:PqqD family protein [Eubacterium sp.]
MKIKEGFILKDLGGQMVVVAVGNATQTLNGMIKLNDSGVVLWKKLESGATEDELKDALMEKYEISEETAKEDVAAFVNSLKGPGIIE